MKTHTRFPKCTALVALVLAAACTETTPLAPGAEFDEPVEVAFRMQRVTGGASMQVASGLVFQLAGTALPITIDDVTSLTLTVDSIQVLPEGDDDNDAAWLTVVLDAPAALDLKALPTADDTPIVIASGTLEAGTYRQVRLFVSDPVIVFAAPISLGAAITYEADTEYEVTIPSAAQTGLKTDVSFEAVADTDVDLFFDEGATFGNVAVTGNGRVMLAPVLRGNSTGS